MSANMLNIIFFHLMKPSTFDCLRSINNQLHNKISQENEYDLYLKRIENIVERRPFKDASTEFYRGWLHKIKNVAKKHTQMEESGKIQTQNKFLLDKIMLNKSRAVKVAPSQSYHLHISQKRNRQVIKINEENQKMIKRILQQSSDLKKYNRKEKHSPQKSLEKKTQYVFWSYSPLKQRKLPKLITLSKESEAEEITLINKSSK